MKFKRYKYTLFILLLINTLFNGIVISQTYVELNNDLQILEKSLYQSHPSIFNYISNNKLDSIFNSKKFLKEEAATSLILEKRIRTILSEIGCIHTSITKSKFKFNKYIMPYLFFVKGDSIWIKKDLSDSLSTHIGSRVISINNNKAKTIINSMKDYHASDGYNITFKYKMINSGIWFNQLYNYYFDTDSIKKIKIISISGDTLELNSKNITFKEKKSNQIPGIKFGKNIYLKLDTFNDLAIIKIKSFSGNSYTAKKRYKKIIKIINKNRIENIVLDLRDNLGGNALSINHLLSNFLIKDRVIDRERKKGHRIKHSTILSKFFYFIDGTFNYLLNSKIKTDTSYIFKTTISKRDNTGFKGNLFVFTNGYTASAASNVTSILKHSGRATIIGEETGGGEEELNGFFTPILKLPISNIKIRVPRYHIHLHMTENKGSGVIPDFKTIYNIHNIIKNENLEMIKLKELISKTL